MEYEVNQRIIELRNFLNLTQQEFSAKIKMSQVGVWRIENNDVKPRKTTVFTICNAFNANSDWLLNGTGEMFLEVNEPSQEVAWKSEAFAVQNKYIERLENEVEWLKTIVNNLSGKIAGANFLNGIVPAGIFGNKNSGNTVRV